METSAEVARLKGVYDEYAARGLDRSRWSNANRGNRAILMERERKARECLARSGFLPLDNKRILDVGCGTGEQLGLFQAWGARAENLFGIDLIPERVQAAQRRFPQITFQTVNAEALPYADGDFDLVAVFTVFTSILNPEMRDNISGEISRVLAADGAILWYDFRINNPFNPYVRGMPRTQIRRLFPGFRLALEAVSLVPPLARHLGAFTKLLYAPLRSVPFLRTHLLGLLFKP
jgi:ubiquinone/menaquinone biosynthesis C-methylase UbiE